VGRGGGGGGAGRGGGAMGRRRLWGGEAVAAERERRRRRSGEAVEMGRGGRVSSSHRILLCVSQFLALSECGGGTREWRWDGVVVSVTAIEIFCVSRSCWHCRECGGGTRKWR